MQTKDKFRFALLYLVLALISLIYRVTGRRFLKTALEPELNSYYEPLPSEHNHTDEY